MVYTQPFKYVPGDPNVICDVCGRKRKRSECVMAYGSGMIPVVMSCKDGCADSNHPLNYPPPVIFDGRPIPDARPDVTGNQITYISVTVPSGQHWGKFSMGRWGSFNFPNNEFNLNGIYTWGNFDPV